MEAIRDKRHHNEEVATTLDSAFDRFSSIVGCSVYSQILRLHWLVSESTKRLIAVLPLSEPVSPTPLQSWKRINDPLLFQGEITPDSYRIAFFEFVNSKPGV